MSKNTRNRILLTAIAAVLLVTLAIGGTMAWLTDDTDAVTNTFTPTTLEVDLTETGVDENDRANSYEMIPGATIDKDPKVTYSTDVDAWLFVRVSEENRADYFLDYSVITGDGAWTALENNPGVYYMAVAAGSSSTTGISVIMDAAGNADKVTVSSGVTKDDMDTLISQGEANYPQLVFDAYIIQQEGFSTPAAAWAEVSK